MLVRRLDIGTLRKAEKTPQGFLRVDAYLTRTGVFEYRQADGSVRRELRRPDAVFDAAALDSFSMAPITDDHPPAMLDPSNAREHQRGHLGEVVKRDGDKVRASALITDAGLIAKMEKGKSQISCGYTCELDMTPGEWNGVKYDAVQTNIKGNHVAVVDVGRAGKDCIARMDAAEMLDQIQERAMHKIRIDGVEFEVSESAAQAFAKYDAAHDSALAGAKASADKAQAAHDAAKAELAKEQAARKDAEDPAKFDARVKARVALEAVASKYLGAEKLDGLSDRDIKCKVVAKLSTEVPAEKRDSDAYVDGRFDAAVSGAGSDALAAVRGATHEATRSDSTGDKVEEARAKARKDMADAWKVIPGAVVKK